MNPGSISRRYARALFELAREQGCLDRIHDELDGFNKLLAGSTDLQDVYLSPSYGREQQATILRKMLGGKVHTLTLNFLLLLASRSRMSVLEEVVRAFNELWDAEAKIVRVHIASAAPLPAAAEKRLTDRLSSMMVGQRIEVTREVDPGLLGGAITRVGHTIYDGSLATQLSRLGRYLQSGENT